MSMQLESLGTGSLRMEAGYSVHMLASIAGMQPVLHVGLPATRLTLRVSPVSLGSQLGQQLCAGAHDALQALAAAGSIQATLHLRDAEQLICSWLLLEACT